MIAKVDAAQSADGEVVPVEDIDPLHITQEPSIGKLPYDHPDRVAVREHRAKVERHLLPHEAADRFESPEEICAAISCLARRLMHSGGTPASIVFALLRALNDVDSDIVADFALRMTRRSAPRFGALGDEAEPGCTDPASCEDGPGEAVVRRAVAKGGAA
jgi:hypothetical protein